MKSALFTLLLISANSAHAGWGDVLNKVLNAVGGRVNCIATYSQSRSQYNFIISSLHERKTYQLPSKHLNVRSESIKLRKGLLDLQKSFATLLIALPRVINSAFPVEKKSSKKFTAFFSKTP